MINLVDHEGDIISQAELTENDEWQYVFTDLPEFLAGNKLVYHVTENSVDNYSISVTENNEGFTVTNSYTPEETSVTVSKGWNDVSNQDGKRPSSASVQLYANGVAHGSPIQVTSDNNWTYTWTGLDLNDDGNPITYTVDEIDVPEGYTATVNNEDKGNLIITNAYTPEIAQFFVDTIWNDEDNQDGIRPENTTVRLLADGEIVRTVELNNANSWQHTFPNLPVYTNGEAIEYTLEEDNVEEYTTGINRNGNRFTVTNSYTVLKTTASVSKVWNDEDDQDGIRPSTVGVQLRANGVPHGSLVSLNESNNWSHTWTDLDVNSEGHPIVYTLREPSIGNGYSVSVNDNDKDNMVVTSTHIPSLIQLTINKVWDDVNDQDGIRPSEVTINLLADNSVLDTVILNDGNSWNHVFSNLPEFNDGNSIVYDIEEDDVEEYTTVITSSNRVYTVTNSYVPHVPVVTIEKETETETVPFDKETVEDNTIEQGYEEVTQQGVNGVRTIVYEVTYTDGEETNRTIKSDSITTEPVTEITTIGTQVTRTEEETETEVIPFDQDTVEDNSIEQGYREITQQGVNGVRTIVYEVTYVNDVETDRTEKSRSVTTEPVTEITTIGTQVTRIEEETETEVIPFEKETVYDDTLDEGYEEVTRQGVNGEETIIYEVTYVNDVETDRTETSRSVTTEPINEITTIGTKPVPVIEVVEETETEVIPFEKETVEDDTFDVGYEEVTQEGVDGVETVIYDVTYTDGVETDRTEKSRSVTTEPITEITTIGTKEPDPEEPEDE